MKELTNRNILVTGGAGFIGSHIADSLLSESANVLIIDNYLTGKKANNVSHESLTIIEGDIRDKILIDKIYDEFRPEIVVHAAASFKDPYNWREDVTTNILGMINLIEASQKKHIERFIYLQTSLAYGLNPVDVPIKLNTPLFSGTFKGGSSYAISKTAAELYLELSGLNFISFRLANTYGPRNLSGPLPTFYQLLKAQKKVYITDTKRDFIFVNDLVACIMKAIKGYGRSGFYHLGTGVDFSVKDLFELTLKYLSTEIVNPNFEYVKKGDDDVDTILLDISNTVSEFDWTPKTSVENGVIKSLQWYKTFGINDTYTHLKGIK